jgi:cystathionine beta-lyase/cystathionine gamma-synthase
LGFGTRSVHAPELPPQPGTPVAPPIELTSIHEFDDSEVFAEASAARTGKGYLYSRWANPTVDSFEASVADLEGAEGSQAFASGMAAIVGTFLSLCESGDRIVATRQLYGNSYSMLAEVLPRYGIETTFVNHDDHDALAEPLKGAKLLYCETIGNPRVQVADLPVMAQAAQEAGVPLVVDNTFASPALCRPIEYGASIVLHSATKYIGGHSDLLGGVVCANDEHLDRLRSHARNFGAILSPFNAWLCIRGLATLPLRVERSSASALKVAEALDAHPDVDAVYYPALDGDPSKELSDRLLGGRGGGVVGFDVSGGKERATSFQQDLRLVKRAASLGGTKSLLVHAASITHTQLSAEELRAAGISEGFCRLSVGLEDPEDLIDDLERALKA